jgi:hypothetical protein
VASTASTAIDSALASMTATPRFYGTRSNATVRASRLGLAVRWAAPHASA